LSGKRMINAAVIYSDAFLSLPLSSQCLYFHLCVNGDDDGFIQNPKTISRMIGCNTGDLEKLVEGKLVYLFDSGPCVIRHWHVHNKLRNDRYHATLCQSEKALLTLNESDKQYYLTDGCQVDNQMTTNWQPSDNQLETEHNVTQLNPTEQSITERNDNVTPICINNPSCSSITIPNESEVIGELKRLQQQLEILIDDVPYQADRFIRYRCNRL